jgi:HEAT repeat protein
MVCLAVVRLTSAAVIAAGVFAYCGELASGQAPAKSRATDDTTAQDIASAIRLLKYESSSVRVLGAKMLEGLGNKAAVAIPDLIAVLGDNRHEGVAVFPGRNPTVGDSASLALESMGSKAVPALVNAMLAGPDKSTRARAARALVALLEKGREEGAIIKALDRATKDPEEDVRRIAVQGFGVAGPKARVAVTRVVELLKGDAGEWVRYEAAIVSCLIDPGNERVAASLTDALTDRSAQVTGAAARSLGSLGSRAKSSVPALINALDDQRERYRPLAPDFTGTRAVRCDVAEALGRIGDAAMAALPALRRIVVRDHDPEARVFAAVAISRIEPQDKEALRAVIKELEDSREGTAGPEAAIEALSQWSPKAQAAVPALVRLLGNEDASLRGGAATALAELGDRAVIPQLERLLEDKEQSVREAARASLEKLRDH